LVHHIALAPGGQSRRLDCRTTQVLAYRPRGPVHCGRADIREFESAYLHETVTCTRHWSKPWWSGKQRRL